jgi:hypothetical protein
MECSSKVLATLVCALGLATAAQADVWKWVDADGNAHYVDTVRPIYTWVDENGDAHYSDTPDYAGAVSVELVWVSAGTLDGVQEHAADEDGSDRALPGETPERRAERERAQAYYCKRATEIYDSYVNAPRLYKTNADGEREYLDEDEAAQAVAKTRAQKDELCR